MKHQNPLAPRTLSGRDSAILAGLLLTLIGGTACNSSARSPHGGNNEPGEILDNPDGSGQFVVDPNNGGLGQELRIIGQWWGRRVNIFDVTGALQFEGYVIGNDIATDNNDYVLERNPVTAEENLTILHVAGTPEFLDAFRRVDQFLTPVFDNGLSGSGVFSMVPRNAAIVIQFDDLLDPELISDETILVRIGVPTVLPFESRILIDGNHGDLADFTGGSEDEFYTTRIIIDTTVTELESFATDPPLQVNGVGLPASVNVSLSNVVIRIPTKLDSLALQEIVLENPSGHRVATSNNGTVDFGSSTQDVVRAMRSGGNNSVTGDPSNGFLSDDTAPEVIGVQQVTIISVQDDPVSADPFDFIIDEMLFASAFCAQAPSPGDVIRQPSLFAEVMQAAGGVTQDGFVFNLRVRLIRIPPEWEGPEQWLVSAPGGAQYLSPYSPLDDFATAACFLRVFPQPSGFPSSPTFGVFTFSEFTVRFSEPIDKASVTAFDSLTVTRRPIPTSILDDPLSTSDYVVGVLDQSVDLQQFTFEPDLPLAHEHLSSETYFLTMHSGDVAPTDLSGNPVVFSLPEIVLTVEPSQPTEFNGGRVSRFTNEDEEAPFGDPVNGPLPEYFGQHIYDIGLELIRPRPVIRFSATADRTQILPGLMAPPPVGGVVEPLVNLGCKLQTIWRYVDVGLAIDDPVDHNIDVERLNWAPLGGQIVADHFERFEISLAHAGFAADEWINPGPPPFVQSPASGLVDFYTTNQLDPGIDALQVVHPRALGYSVNPGDTFLSDTGTVLIPFPLNRNVAPQDVRFYTWRDTSIQTRGGPSMITVPPLQWYANSEDCLPTMTDMMGNVLLLPFFGVNDVETIGLPLLMEFKTFPDDQALGLNTFDVSLAVPTGFTRPFFRAFSAGGLDQTLNEITVDPDLETRANGGFNPNSAPSGQTTPGNDVIFYVGGMDLVVRVSRSYSVWFKTLGPLGVGGIPADLPNPIFSRPVMEPRLEEQPQGTSITIAFRGADSFNGTPNQVAEQRGDASTLDSYGDHYDPPATCDCPDGCPQHGLVFANTGIGFHSSDQSWHDFPAPASGEPFAVDGAEFYQLRITFLSNTETGLTAELSALGVTWEQ